MLCFYPLCASQEPRRISISPLPQDSAYSLLSLKWYLPPPRLPVPIVPLTLPLTSWVAVWVLNIPGSLDLFPSFVLLGGHGTFRHAGYLDVLIHSFIHSARVNHHTHVEVRGQHGGVGELVRFGGKQLCPLNHLKGSPPFSLYTLIFFRKMLR